MVPWEQDVKSGNYYLTLLAQGKLVPQHLQNQGQTYPNAAVQQVIVQQSIQSAPWQQAQQVIYSITIK